MTNEEMLENDIPVFMIKATLNPKVRLTERQVYDVFTMISDLGGFNGTIVMLMQIFLQVVFQLDAFF
jgi:hypothetical protein